MRRQNFNKPQRISHIFPSARGPNRRSFQSLNKKPPCYLRAPLFIFIFLGVAPSNPKHCKWPLDMASLAGGKVLLAERRGLLCVISHKLFRVRVVSDDAFPVWNTRSGGRTIIDFGAELYSLAFKNRPRAHSVSVAVGVCKALRCLHYQWI